MTGGREERRVWVVQWNRVGRNENVKELHLRREFYPDAEDARRAATAAIGTYSVEILSITEGVV